MSRNKYELHVTQHRFHGKSFTQLLAEWYPGYKEVINDWGTPVRVSKKEQQEVSYTTIKNNERGTVHTILETSEGRDSGTAITIEKMAKGRGLYITRVTSQLFLPDEVLAEVARILLLNAGPLLPETRPNKGN